MYIKNNVAFEIFVNKEIFISVFNDFVNRDIGFLFLIDFDMRRFFINELSQLEDEAILFNFNGIKNYCAEKRVGKEVFIKSYPVSYNDYLKKFDFVQRQLREGNSYLLNLTLPTEIEINLTLDEIFYSSKSLYKLKFFNDFVFFSPETFVKVVDGYIYTYPMKGTIDANIPDAKNRILKDEKELAEHITVVDLLRNDLNIVSQSVEVTKFRFISTVRKGSSELYQVSSEIRGRLPVNYKSDLANVLLTLLPAGSVTGAPKRKTVEIIKEVEGYNRGFYTGIAGVYYKGVLDTCVMIRFIENVKGRFFYKSGGGITVYSNPAVEYNELIEKIYVPTV